MCAGSGQRQRRPVCGTKKTLMRTCLPCWLYIYIVLNDMRCGGLFLFPCGHRYLMSPMGGKTKTIADSPESPYAQPTEEKSGRDRGPRQEVDYGRVCQTESLTVSGLLDRA